MPHRERRDSARIVALIECHCCNIECFGTIANISENGMFIRSEKISLPLESQFDICIPFKEEVLNVHVIINRMTKSKGYYDGIGVGIFNPSEKYLEFINQLRLSSRLKFIPHSFISSLNK